MLYYLDFATDFNIDEGSQLFELASNQPDLSVISVNGDSGVVVDPLAVDGSVSNNTVTQLIDTKQSGLYFE